jgi:hypothetical protein|tara:strand:+ start:389 stop:586 length:198 start_codon:yes stop_codon:yes gene_type:complete
MNQSEFNKILAELQKLVKSDWYFYGMKLYEVFPCQWLALLKNAEQLAMANMKIEDGSFIIESCGN